jgi:8-oxo-dGTP diphosphatase
MKPSIPYRISVLIFLQDEAGRHLLLQRKKAPNLGCWSPIGGKLEMDQGESPFQCAIREIHEEASLKVSTSDLHLFSIVSEKNYEGHGHWLMFLFQCRKLLTTMPPPMEEGDFGLFTRTEIDSLPIAESDRLALWPVYDRHRDSFVCMRADTMPNGDLEVEIEEILP